MTEKKRQDLCNPDKEIFCNLCGMSCRGVVGNFNGLIEAKVYGAYDSTHLGDGDIYKFSLCERCLSELFDKFKLTSHLIANYIFPEDIDLIRDDEIREDLKQAEEERQKILAEFFKKKEVERLSDDK